MTLRDGIVLDMDFREGVGTVTRDKSGEDHIGTLFNTPTWIAGGGLTLDSGGTEHVRVLNAASLNTSYWTVFGKINTTTVSRDVIRKWNTAGDQREWGLIITVGGFLQLYHDSVGDYSDVAILTSATVVTDGEDHIFALKRSIDGYLYMYVNGRREARTAYTTAFISTANIRIGQTQLAGYFDGNQYMVRIYDIELSDREISQLYEQWRTPKLSDGIVLDMDFAEGYGEDSDENPLIKAESEANAVLDKSGEGNHGSLAAYLENYNDDETYWSTGGTGAGAYTLTITEDIVNQIKGTSCLDCQVGAGANSDLFIQKNYGAGQDWSIYNLYCVYIYGANSGLSGRVALYDSTGSNFRYHNFVDNWSGWKLLVFDLTDPDSVSATPADLSDIQYNRIRWNSLDANYDWKVDRNWLVPGPAWSEDGLIFDGEDDIIDLGNLALGTGDLSVEAVSKTSSATQSTVWALAGGAGANIFKLQNTSSVFDVYGREGDADSARLVSTTPSNDNVERHTVVTRRGTTVSLYVDGRLENVSTDAEWGANLGAINKIGQSQGSGANWDGLIPKIRIYNRALSEQEVARLYEEWK